MAEKPNSSDTSKEDMNKGTMTLDVICALVNIRHPQDVIVNVSEKSILLLQKTQCKENQEDIP